ncbi:MAG: hypothetical protein LWX51_14445 [Deltaproteobacteria bacterium]|jgi:hypothetical protein|nr:hypothetical protein [Deltaproteobacteria bacterium]
MNQEEHFPRLHKNQLELYALDWVKQYPDVPIKSIILYTYMSPYENKKVSLGSIDTQYAIVFEIDEKKEEPVEVEPIDDWTYITTDNIDGTKEEPVPVKVMLNEDEWAEYRDKKITGEIPTKPYEELWADTCAITCEDVDIIRPAAFKNVYRQTPSGDYRGEWTVILKFLNTTLPKAVRTDRPSWILYDLSETHNVPNESLTTSHNSLHDVIESDHPELQKHDNVFCLCGNDWYVKYNGKSDTIPDLKGMRYIVFLLENPDDKFSPLKLEQLVYGKQPEHNKDYSEMSPEQLEKESLSTDESCFEDMAQEEKVKLKNTALETWERAKSGNPKDVEA